MSILFDFFELTGRNIYSLYDSIFQSKSSNRRRNRNTRKRRRRADEISLLRRIADTLGIYTSKKKREKMTEEEINSQLYLQRKKRINEYKTKKFTNLYDEIEEEEKLENKNEISFHQNNNNFESGCMQDEEDNISTQSSKIASQEEMNPEESEKIKNLQEELEKLRQEIFKIACKSDNELDSTPSNKLIQKENQISSIPTPPPPPPLLEFTEAPKLVDITQKNNIETAQGDVANIIKNAIVNGRTKLKPIVRNSPSKRKTDEENNNLQFVIALKKKFYTVRDSPSKTNSPGNSEWEESFVN